jgi:hypothetical protein
MKTKILFHFLVYSLSVIFLFSCQNRIFAQDKIVKTEVKGGKNTYMQTILNNSKGECETKVLKNRKYNLDEVHKQRIPDSPSASFLIYRLNTHEKFLNAINKSFGKERIACLAKKNMKFEINFVLDKQGGILGIVFRLSGKNDISILEIEQLEKELETNITFEPIGRSEKDYPGEYPVRTSFNEIEQGKVKAILTQEERIDNWYIFK